MDVEESAKTEAPSSARDALLGASYLDVLARMSEPSDASDASERLKAVLVRRSDASDILGITDV